MNILNLITPKTKDAPVIRKEERRLTSSDKLNLIKLKIKGKSLAEEARIIRKEERKLTGESRNILVEHRKGTVREHARATYLAIAFIKHRSYKTVEPKCRATSYRDTYITPKVAAMVKKYGAYGDDRSIAKWFKE